jgi:hypothetical protein
MKVTPREKERLRTVCALLREAEKPVRIMRALLWSPEVRAGFFASKARELPVVEYPRFDAEPTLARVAEARRLIVADTTIDRWLLRLCEAVAGGARMLAGLGRPEFHDVSGVGAAV